MPNRGLIDTHMQHEPRICQAVLRQTFVHFDVWKIPTILGMTNTEPNLLSLGRVLRYTLLVISQIFTKCHIYVAAFNRPSTVWVDYMEILLGWMHYLSQALSRYNWKPIKILLLLKSLIKIQNKNEYKSAIKIKSFKFCNNLGCSYLFFIFFLPHPPFRILGRWVRNFIFKI